MFFRQKKSGNRVYLQIVENRWEDGRSKQRVIATLGRLDQLQQTGQLEGLLRSGAKFCESVLLLAAHRRGETIEMRTRSIGPAMIFERLWKETGCQKVIRRLLEERKFEFPVERAVIGKPRNGKKPSRSRELIDFSCTICTGRWLGWVSRCPTISRPEPPRFRRARPRTSSKRGCLGTVALWFASTKRKPARMLMTARRSWLPCASNSSGATNRWLRTSTAGCATTSSSAATWDRITWPAPPPRVSYHDRRKSRAGEGIRTPDVQLGNVAIKP